MCMVMCRWCGNILGSFPCLFHQYPEKFKKVHPKLFAKYTRLQKEMKEKHKCKNKNLKERIDYWHNAWEEMSRNYLMLAEKVKETK